MTLDSAEVEDTKWRIGVLFLGFIIISFFLEKGMHSIEGYLKKRKLKALKHSFHKVQAELTMLGCISLLLVILEDLLRDSCIVGHGRRRNLLTDANHTDDHGDDHSSSHDSSTDSDCDPFWTQHIVHQVHIFLFVLSATHILYAGISFSISMYKIKQWRRWEAMAISGEYVAPICEELVGEFPRETWKQLTLSFTAQFSSHINEEVYILLRRLFISRTRVPTDFNFAAFVQLSMQEELSNVIAMEWPMFLMAGVVILVPNFIRLQYWLPGVGLTITTIMGMKLVIVTMQMARYTWYRENNDADNSVAATNDGAPLSAESEAEAETDDGTMPSGGPKLQVRLSTICGATGNSDDNVLDPDYVLDARDLFWFRKPRIMLLVFQYTLFENSLSMAAILFTLWQEPSYMSAFEFGGLAAILMVVDFIVMVHAAAVVLPCYALAATVGSHCLESIQKEAMHSSSNPAKMQAAYMPHEISTETPLRQRSLKERSPFEGVLPHAPAPVAANIQKKRSRRSSWKAMLGIPENEPSLKKLESMPAKPVQSAFEEHHDAQTSLSMLLGGYHKQRLIEAQENGDSITSPEEGDEPRADCDTANQRALEMDLAGDDDSSGGRPSLDEDPRKRAASMPMLVTMNSVYRMEECDEGEASPLGAAEDMSSDTKPPVKEPGSRQRERRGSLPTTTLSHQEEEDDKEEEKRKRRFSLEAQSPRRSITDIFELP
ncbi:hypothetical protein CYMTET_36143, partial [Cymbomonas tetramitiformis]